MKLLALSSAAVLSLAAVCAADASVLVANNTTVAATFVSGDETHAYGATIPAGAKFSVALRPAKHGPALHATLNSPVGTSLGDKSGKAPSFKNVAAATSGRYALTVASADGATTGGYSVAIAWKSPKGSTKTVVVDPDASGSIAFSADAGATATISLKKVKGSAAVPVLARIETPDGVPIPLAAGPSAAAGLNATGDFVVRFGAGPAGGGVKAVVGVKPPKARKISVALSAVAPGAEVTTLTRIGPPGGALVIDAGPLDGASVSIPAGALAAPTSILLGDAFSVAGVQPGVAAGPTIFAGPEGLTFPAGKPATVTIPFDPSAFGADLSKLRVYTRDASGAVTLVLDPVVDLLNHLVSFPAPHFSAFQVVSDFRFVETQLVENAAGTTRHNLGGCLALSGDVAAAGQFIPGANTWEVQTFHRSGSTFTSEAVLLPPLQQSFDNFAGTFLSLAASGDRVLVGASGRTTSFGIHSGAGFVFVRDATGGWAYEAELSLPTSVTNESVGAAVVLDGDTALLTAPSAPAAASSSQGAAYVFVRDATSGAWSFQQALIAPSATTTSFGYQPTIQGDTAVVLGFGSGSSALHVFRRSAGVWTETETIDAPAAGGSPGAFAFPAIDGTTIAVGYGPASSGSSEVLVDEDQGSGFVEAARLPSSFATGPGEAVGTAYARSISVRGDLLLVGAQSFSPRFVGASAALNQAGDAFLYRRIGGRWRYAARLRGTQNDAFPLAALDDFGNRTVLDGTTALVASDQRQTVDGRVGALYVFDLSGN